MIGKRTILAAGASVALLVGAGSAAAAYGKPGPPSNAPRTGLQAGAQQGYGLMAGGVVVEAAADYLGVSETALAADRHAGQSLADVATANGKSVDGLETALVAAVKTHLAAAVADGRLTQTQADAALAAFKAQVHTVVTRTATGPLAGRGQGMGLGMGLGLGMGRGMGACGGLR